MTTTVIHRSVMQKGDVYIGRPSKWGNPYVMPRDGDRAAVIRQFRKHLEGSPELLAALPELKGKRLACHCHPLPCHGDVLAEFADRAEVAR